MPNCVKELAIIGCGSSNYPTLEEAGINTVITIMRFGSELLDARKKINIRFDLA